MAQGSSRAIGAAALETTKRTAAKAAAATLVSAMATAVALDTKAGFAAAQAKAQLLVQAYGELAAARLP